MEVRVDHHDSKVYVGLKKLPDGCEDQVTHTLQKHGLLLHWDGHGTLLGVEFTTGVCEPIEVVEMELA